MPKLGETLKKYREHYQLTVRELAALTDVSYSLISKYENDKREPSLAYIYRLQHRVLNLPPNEFEKFLNVNKIGKIAPNNASVDDEITFVWKFEKKVEGTIIDYFSIENEEGGEIYYGRGK